jgi:SEC-C motif-containing protein
VEWTGLQILATKDGQPGDITGMVEFRASYRAGKRHIVLHEVCHATSGAHGTWLDSVVSSAAAESGKN